MHPDDTIAAISSAVGPAARMIVRSSGPAARSIARSICDNLPPAGHARVTQLRFAGLVPAHVYLFAAPRSYTGQDLVEYHIPGNPILARMLLDALVAAGARHAEAGEFTARAYFAGRLDLAEAEGVAATVSAHGEQELRAARQLMSSELARRLRAPTDALVETLALVEAGIDFSDEDVTFLSGDEVFRRVQSIDGLLDEIVRTSARFEPLTHEPTFVLVGRPNAGKSTLLNALAGASRAVVSDAAGTTRDVLSVEVALRRGLVRLLDVAGIEQARAQGDSPGGAAASDPSSEQHDGEPARIASLMQRHALRELEAADFVVLVSDSSDTRPLLPTPRPADLVVRTKGDVTGHRDAVSAVTGQGMDALRDRLDQLAFGATWTDDLSSSTSRPTLALNARHLHAIAEARDALSRAAEVARSGAGGELVALELRDALDALGGVLGQVTPDDVIGRIFSTFCIGK